MYYHIQQHTADALVSRPQQRNVRICQEMSGKNRPPVAQTASNPTQSRVRLRLSRTPQPLSTHSPLMRKQRRHCHYPENNRPYGRLDGGYFQRNHPCSLAVCTPRDESRHWFRRVHSVADSGRRWIPAFAGMTGVSAGMAI